MRFDRTLLLAPHPDDDVIAAGGLIQHVLNSGGQLHIVFATDGESNPWPQRWMLRKWWITAADRAAWGAMRRDEALASLASLGAAHVSTTFLALPDRALSKTAVELAAVLRKTIDAYQPTLIITTSSYDQHADHRALARAAHATAGSTPLFTYVIHGSAADDRVAFRIGLTEMQQRRKRAAIECHRSQMTLSRERFLSHVTHSESFLVAEFDVIAGRSAVLEGIAACRHSLNAVFRSYPARETSGVEAAADVEDRPRDVAGLL